MYNSPIVVLFFTLSFFREFDVCRCISGLAGEIGTRLGFTQSKRLLNPRFTCVSVGFFMSKGKQMVRYRAIFDKQGKAREYEDGILVWIRPGLEEEEQKRKAHFIRKDLEEFVSPIDKTVVRGYAQYRKHCKQYNVVPTQDLAGLPARPQQSNPDGLKQAIIENVNKYTR
jgi:hypothetical protein